MDLQYFVGLDLGQTTDFSALAVLERPAEADPSGAEPVYALRHLQRFALGTPYTAIVASVAALMAGPPFAGETRLVVDQTGVGRAVVDMLRQAVRSAYLIPITITGGLSVTREPDGSYHVPKKELVTCMQLLFENRRLRIARSLPEADTLVRELQNFQVKITLAAHETFGNWRQGIHDDLVLAVALACWYAEQHPPWPKDAFGGGGRSIIANAPKEVFFPIGDESVADALDRISHW
jgi:hypothetical protein